MCKGVKKLSMLLRKGGQAMIANVNEIYASQRTNTAGIRVTPVFSSYQQYMTYLQSKNSI